MNILFTTMMVAAVLLAAACDRPAARPRVPATSDAPPATTAAAQGPALADKALAAEAEARGADVVRVLQWKAALAARIGEDKAAQIPMRVGADPAAIALDVTVITQIIPLQKFSATQLSIDLDPLISADAVVTADAGLNVLVVTDTSAKINRLAQIIQKLDRSKSPVANVTADVTSSAGPIPDTDAKIRRLVEIIQGITTVRS